MEMGNKITHWAKCTINHANWATDLSGAPKWELDREQAIFSSDKEMNALSHIYHCN